MALDPTNPLTFAASFEDTVKVLVNYRLLFHSNPASTASSSLAPYTAPFLNHFIYLHRSTHTTPSSILVKISSTLSSKCGLTYPYNSPENWVFFASSSSSASSALAIQPTEMTDIWPFIPMRLGYEGGVPYMSVEIGNRLGPPPLEVLLGWLVDCGVVNRDEDRMSVRDMMEYKDMCWQERVMDARCMTPYITLKCRLYHEVSRHGGNEQQSPVLAASLAGDPSSSMPSRLDHRGLKDAASFISLASIPELALRPTNPHSSLTEGAGTITTKTTSNDGAGGTCSSFHQVGETFVNASGDLQQKEYDEKHGTQDNASPKIKLNVKAPPT